MYCMPFNCEPGNSYSQSSCWDTAHCVKSNVNFASGNSFAQIADYSGNPADAAFVSQFEPSNAKQANGELEMTLVKQGDGKGFGATVINTRAIQYGTVTAVMKSGSASGGVVSSFIIRNDKVGDEIDFEFVGADKATVQSNYYWHDNLDYTKMVKSPIVWTPDQIQWGVNGNIFRTVKRADTWSAATNSFQYPDSESYVSFSIWDGGSGAKGTSDWAGGAIQWGENSFVMGVKSLTIDCFFNGNETTYKPPRAATSDSAEESDKSSEAESATDDVEDSATEDVSEETGATETSTTSSKVTSARTSASSSENSGVSMVASLGALAAALFAATAF
ncbi:concanavalin A-like lectin/glucanase [Linderina pennispora]|uniref:Concanavalin A-like lectin/glucanase n=1 Tax=Linderina pennispora TaxID=61395 RepID=A0A1Y1W1Z3_9FUNG|nr:concanavalin A-like lectin/glucanase [Linderina pennispora]ORX67550.1 concanavalin A-like lectin/glucanase [Linderina pennispora]